MTKWEQVLKSRKAWASLIALGVTLALYQMGEINAAQFASALTTLTGIFVGSVALEDGLSNIMHVWMTDPNTPNVKPRIIGRSSE